MKNVLSCEQEQECTVFKLNVIFITNFNIGFITLLQISLTKVLFQGNYILRKSSMLALKYSY